MRSAYQVLGIPGNAEADDIEAAFEKARQYYSPARLAEKDGAVDKFNDIRTAYRILKDPQSRAAHDRKLAAGANAARRQAIARAQAAETEDDEERGSGRYLAWGLLLVAVLFAVGFYINHQNAEARRLQAQAELAARQQQEKEEQERVAAQQRADDERARARAKAEADERRLSMEARNSAAIASIERNRTEAAATQAQRNAIQEAQRREYALQAEQRRQESEARQRIAMDKQRIRELCWQNYRRPDC